MILDDCFLFGKISPPGSKIASAKTRRGGWRQFRSTHWVKVKNPNAPAVKREAEEAWGR
jgi:hypothetical protein